MKIFFITKELPYPVNSGARIRSWHYLKGLVKAGEVHVICGGTFEDNREGFKVFTDMGVDVAFVKVPVVSSAEKKAGRRLRSLFSSLPHPVFLRVSEDFRNKVRQTIQQSGCDALVCDGIHMALNIPFETSCRKILDEHNVESTIIGRFFNVIRNPWVKVYVLLEWIKFRCFEEKMWKKFDEVHVCSQVDQYQVEKRCAHPCVHVVPNGVDCGEYGMGNMEDGKTQLKPLSVLRDPLSTSPRLVYSGLMGWMPNDDAARYFIREIYPLIKSAQEHRSTGAQEVSCDHVLMAPCAPVEFVIVGKNPTAALKRLAQKDPSIVVTGAVAEVKPFIEESDIVVVPLRIGSGTRLKILEAMAMGKPVVSTSIGCEGLNVTHGKNILVADDPGTFAGYVVDLLNDSQLRLSLAQAGQDLVRMEYDWFLIEDRLAQLIKQQIGLQQLFKDCSGKN